MSAKCWHRPCCIGGNPSNILRTVCWDALSGSAYARIYLSSECQSPPAAMTSSAEVPMQAQPGATKFVGSNEMISFRIAEDAFSC